MNKRLFSMLLVVCMVFTLFPTTAFATEYPHRHKQFTSEFAIQHPNPS